MEVSIDITNVFLTRKMESVVWLYSIAELLQLYSSLCGATCIFFNFVFRVLDKQNNK